MFDPQPKINRNQSSAPKVLKLLVPLIVLFVLNNVQAQDLTRVAPVTNKILMLTFDEGHVDYTDRYGDYGTSVSYYGALNTTNAENKASYSISSSNDANYSTAKQPINIGRKAKAVDYVDLYSTPKYILDHSIYIELPTALVRGRSYTINLNNLTQNTNSYTFVYDEKKMWSPGIHVNQVGFVPGGAKYAYLSQWMGTFNTVAHAAGGLELDSHTGTTFRLVRASDNADVFTGTIAKRKDKTTTETVNYEFGDTRNFTNADVWECNFSSYTTTGEYYISVDGMGRSHTFEIRESAYRDAFYAVSKAIFTQRQGVDKELEGGKVYPRGHHPDDRNVYFTGTTTKLNIWGYYYDAGDWDAYNRHIGVPMDLMLLYDLKPGNFKDGDVANRYRLSSASAWINEGADGLPDLLNEARWLVNFFKRAKDEMLAKGVGTGGVPGGKLPYQGGINHEGYIGPDAVPNGVNSWTDTRTVYVNTEQTANTYNYAGSAAYYAVTLIKFNGTTTTESNSWRTEAINAYNWADGKSDDESGQENIQSKILASAALFRLTGDVKYQNDLKRLLPLDESYPSWDGWHRMQPWHYAAMIIGKCPSNHPNLDVTFQTTLKNHLINHADVSYVNPIANRGLRIAFEERRNTSNGAFSVPRMELVAFAYEMTGDPKYLQVVQNTANYTLGGNENNMSYISGVGHHPDEKTFHPDAMKLNDFNSQVYTNTNFLGYVNYYAHKTCDWMDGCGYLFSGDEDFSRASAYPGIAAWPAGEWRMNNKYSIAGSEFTMEECLSLSAFTYGYLAGSSSVSFTPNARPTISLNLSDGQQFRKEGCELRATASVDTRLVKYYYDWHFIGESTDAANGFRFYWVSPLASGTSVVITAVGYDNKGLITLPSDAGDRSATITSGATCGVAPTTYSLTVTNGTGTGNYASGSVVNIAANTPPSGQVFDKWTGDITHVASATSASTTVTMPAANIGLTATYKTSSGKTPDGYVVRELWSNVTGRTVASIPVGTTPTSTSDLTTLEGPLNVADNYGSRIRGYIIPTTSGLYNFYIASDDNSDLYLSTNDNPANKARIAYVDDWTNQREWTKFASQKSANISLTAGTRYYFEALQKEGDGGDNLSVGWTGPGISAITVIGSANISSYTTVTPTNYTLTVNSGSGSGSYTAGTVVNISANAAPSGQVFDKWTGDIANVASVTSASTTITMPSANASVSATYKSSSTTYTNRWLFNNSGANSVTGGNAAVLVSSAAYSSSNKKEGTHALDLAPSASAYADLGTVNLSSTFSVSMWLYNSGTQIHQNYIIGSTSDYSNESGFYVHVNGWNNTGGSINLRATDGSTNNYVSAPDGSFPFNTWNHFVLTGNTSTGIAKIYINGVEKASGTIPTTMNVNKGMWLGSMLNQAWNTWAGQVDDVQTYNKVLTLSEIQSLYGGTPTTYSLTLNSGSGSGSYTAGTVVNISANAAPSGQVFDKWTGDVTNVASVTSASTTITMPSANASVTATYKTTTTYTNRWPFNNSGANLVTGGNTAVLVNSAAYSTSFKKEGTHSLNLAPSASAYANLGTVNLTGTFSIAMWLYNPGTQMHQNYIIGSTSDQSNESGFYIHVNEWNNTGGGINVRTTNGSTNNYFSAPAGSFPFNTWNHFVFTGNTSTGVGKIYLNGVERATGTIPSTMNLNKTIWLGSMLNQAWNTWPGQIDDVLTYNRVLTLTEIQNMHSSGTPARHGKDSEVFAEVPVPLEVYPNPSKGNVTVLGKGLVKLVQVDGKEVFSKQSNGKLQITDLKKGFYIILLIDNSSIVTKKLIIE